MRSCVSVDCGPLCCEISVFRSYVYIISYVIVTKLKDVIYHDGRLWDAQLIPSKIFNMVTVHEVLIR